MGASGIERYRGPITRHDSVSIASVLSERSGTYLNIQQLFALRFRAIPNVILENTIDAKTAHEWFCQSPYFAQVQDSHYCKRSWKSGKLAELDDAIFFLQHDPLLSFDIHAKMMFLLYRKTPIVEVETLHRELFRFKLQTEDSAKVSLLSSSANCLVTSQFDIKPATVDLHLNYNDDFLPVHDTIMQRLSLPKGKGLVLLHGKPGTGKTSYIRHLIANLEKEVVFLPPQMMLSVTGPEMVPTLAECMNSVFVIEDAEKVVMDRESSALSPVSALLNLADGLLADCLNIQFICSFNTDITKVDKALTRKGRLIARYEFKELRTAKAQALSDSLGFDTKINAPMTLAEIYNQEETDYRQEQGTAAIGFRNSNLN